MVTEAVLSIVAALVEWFAALMPDIDVDGFDPDAVTGFLEYAVDAVDVLAGWVPLALIFGGVGLLLSIEAAVTIFGFIVWLYHQFWGSQ